MVYYVDLTTITFTRGRFDLFVPLDICLRADESLSFSQWLEDEITLWGDAPFKFVHYVDSNGTPVHTQQYD